MADDAGFQGLMDQASRTIAGQQHHHGGGLLGVIVAALVGGAVSHLLSRREVEEVPYRARHAKTVDAD